MQCYSHSQGAEKDQLNAKVGPFKNLTAAGKKLFLTRLLHDLRLLYLFPDEKFKVYLLVSQVGLHEHCNEVTVKIPKSSHSGACSGTLRENLPWSIYLTCTSLNSEWKPEHPEETHADTERTCRLCTDSDPSRESNPGLWHCKALCHRAAQVKHAGTFCYFQGRK